MRCPFLVLLAMFAGVESRKCGTDKYYDFSKKVSFRACEEEVNDRFFNSLREMKLDAYREILDTTGKEPLPYMVPILEKYGILEQAFNIIFRHLLEILDEMEELLRHFFDTLHPNREERHNLWKAARRMKILDGVIGYMTKLYLWVPKWSESWGKGTLGWIRNWVQAELECVRQRVKKLYEENKTIALRKATKHGFPIKLVTQKPRNVDEFLAQEFEKTRKPTSPKTQSPVNRTRVPVMLQVRQSAQPVQTDQSNNQTLLFVVMGTIMLSLLFVVVLCFLRRRKATQKLNNEGERR